MRWSEHVFLDWFKNLKGKKFENLISPYKNNIECSAWSWTSSNYSSPQNDIDFRFKLTINLLLGLPFKLMISQLSHANIPKHNKWSSPKKMTSLSGATWSLTKKKKEKYTIGYATIRSIALHLIKHITCVGINFFCVCKFYNSQLENKMIRHQYLMSSYYNFMSCNQKYLIAVCLYSV